ncbi:hypothetical protein [Endozoicomonas sp. YOMI1]|uniref:hypothetical protein n=1 Tax=Endozoicomonas sp. YOMI1 TaxID=2828739 RepID=UPI002149475A|nr:hypothetical protein [Endozoicomonas sp. YOMI1]
MFSSSITNTPETLRPIDSQESRPSASTAAKAFKYGTYGILSVFYGGLTILAIDCVQLYFNQPAEVFLDDHCFANATGQWNNYHKLRNEHEYLSYFAQSVISGSITFAAHVFMNKMFPNQTSAPPTPSNTENQPAHSQSAVEITIANKHLAMV